MPYLDVMGTLPIVAVDAAMMFPAADDQSAQMRRALYEYQLQRYADYLVSEGVKDLPDDAEAMLGRKLKKPKIRASRLKAALVVANVFITYASLMRNEQDRASWHNAMVATQPFLKSAGMPASTSYIWKQITEFKPAAHLWAVSHLRDWRFQKGADSPFTILEDLDCFLMESETLRSYAQSWSRDFDKAEPPLNVDCWRVPPDWKPRKRRPGFPADVGRLHNFTLPDPVLAPLRPKGRPAASP